MKKLSWCEPWSRVLDDAQQARGHLEHVGRETGPIAKPEKIDFVDSLHKTQSGKIMPRLLEARALGLPEGDVSTLEE